MEPQVERVDSQCQQAEQLVQELLMSPEGRTDPYPRYHRLRQLAPIHKSVLGFWVLSRHDDCAAVLEDPRFNKDYARQNDSRIGPQWREHVSLTDGARSMVNLDGAEHARVRRLVVKAFTRKTVEALRPRIEQTVHDLLDPLADAGGGDVLQTLAFPLALNVIGEMLGVPPEDRAQFPGLVRDLLVVFETRPSDAQLAVADAAQLQFRGYFQELIAEKRKRPGADLLSKLIALDDDGDRLLDEELWMLATLLFGAGFETTANEVGNGLLALLDHPTEMARLRADPSLARALPDEVFRYDGTAQMTVRVAAEDVSVRGVRIAAGETVLALLGAANRDPVRYAQPDRFDLARTNIQPLTFGGGVHYCLGAGLARVEIEVAFRILLERFSTLELVGRPRVRDRITLRGLEALHVQGRPAKRP